MFKAIKNFLTVRKGNLVENIIYIIIIGGLSFAFYTNSVQAPMTDNMNSLNTQLKTWTTVGP